MYVPPAFEEDNPERLRAFIRRYPLGTLVTATANGLDANLVHLLICISGDKNATLHGHIARANPLWKDVAADAPVLVIFHGPDGFISPSWYPSTRDHGRVVPTWNYAVVHAHGRVRFIDDAAWVRRHVEALTHEHEATRDAPWAVADAPADFVDKMVTAVVGLEVSITRCYGKWKVSQNRSVADRLGVIGALEHQGSESSLAMAALVKETLREG